MTLKGFLLLVKAPGQAMFLLFFSRSAATSHDDQSIQSVATFSLFLSEVACGGIGAAYACVPLDSSSLADLAEHLGWLLLWHVCVPAVGGGVPHACAAFILQDK